MPDARHLRLVGHSDLGGRGDGMQVMVSGDIAYVGHLGTSGAGTSLLDVSDPTDPRLVRQWPAPAGTHTHEVQVADGLLLVNEERFGDGGPPHGAGMVVYDLADPLDPRRIGYLACGGGGVHRIVWTGGRYAYVSATPPGFDDRIFVIVDLDDPEQPVETGRWWWPGAWSGAGERPTWPDDRRYAAHHALVDGDRAYLGYGDAGMVILDVSDVTRPRRVSDLSWSPGGDTHTCLPLTGRGLVVVTDEAIAERCAEDEKRVRVVDVADERAPRVVGLCPAPEGDFCDRGLRFGPHNLHENRPDSYRSETLVFVTYFNAGLRVYDLSTASAPVEVAHWLPAPPAGQEAPQLNDLFVTTDGTIYVTDRISGGLYVLHAEPELRRRMAEAAA